MRSFSLLATTLFTAALFSQCSSAATSSSEILPACGLLCIETGTLSSTCELTDTKCICTNAPLQAQISACVMSNCTIKEALETEKYSYDSCGQTGEDRRSLVWIVAVVFGVLGLVAFFFRCLARLHVGAQSWGMDDWVMCLAVCFMVPLTIISIPLSQHGLGLDMWNVSFDNITKILYYYYWDEIIYITALALTKISILFFYLKVFPKRSFRWCAYILIALNFCYALSFDIALVFQCSPIDGAWKSWDGEYKAKCISINHIGWAAAAVNIALDLGTIILPLPELFNLSMSLKKKMQIMLMFAVGFFVTFVSAIRLHSLIEFGNTRNVTQDYVEVGYWSTIEVPVGVICACMPAIRSLFSLVFPKVFGTTQRDKTGYGSQGYPSKGGLNTSGSTHIRVKQEWTVISDQANNASDVELVSFDMMTKEDSPTRRVTLGKERGMWTGQEASIRADTQ